MMEKTKAENKLEIERQSGMSDSIGISFLAPRIWKILIILALPFIVISANYGEALENTGAFGAYIADMLLPVAIIGYLVLIAVFKRRDM